MSRLTSIFLSACVLQFLQYTCQNAFAQNPRGTLRGTVQDISGARVPGAKIIAHNADLSLSRQTHSDDRGEFRLEDLLPGPYILTVNTPGFAEARSEVVVAISSVRTVRVSLQPKSVAEQVVVRAAAQSITAEPLETASAVHQAIIYPQELGCIP